ncbi:hypothetical protein PVK06_013349 [Gossypium arboreum]|uniref:Uncharacterized protein n=1 Tax=Gossypium arboreum TaxID=29729 RepID=A0ABR0QE82_GOSAR|nr:hypothetical protein PVK06_013349 [Gossypium arboreum]
MRGFFLLLLSVLTHRRLSPDLIRILCRCVRHPKLRLFREVEIEEDDELFIGPPPPALVAEAESANEAESFEETKCPHPQARQAFVILNKALKDLQDLDKVRAELQAMREAAQWRRLQVEVKVPPKRDEWMTTLPSESKPGVTKQSARSNKNGKEGRGDTGVWTDTPLELA